MTAPVVVSAKTADELARVAAFFGIDLELNRHIFRHAAQADARAFEVVVKALDEAVQQDLRFGTQRRIRERLDEEKRKRNEAAVGPVGRNAQKGGC